MPSGPNGSLSALPVLPSSLSTTNVLTYRMNLAVVVLRNKKPFPSSSLQPRWLVLQMPKVPIHPLVALGLVPVGRVVLWHGMLYV